MKPKSISGTCGVMNIKCHILKSNTLYIMLTKHEPAPACNHCNEEHVYVVNIMHVMMYVPRSHCSHCIITECMLIDVCFVMYVMQEPQGEQCCALMGYSWVNMT